MKRLLPFAVVVLGLIVAPMPAQAALITGVSIAEVSSELTQSFDRGAVRTVDGSGLNINGPGTHSNVPDGTMWLNTGNGCCGGFSNTGPGNADSAPSITFNLGKQYTLDSMRIWNYNENSGNPALFTGRGIQTTDVLVSNDNVVFTPLPGIFTFNKAPGSDTVDFSQLIALGNVSAQYVRFNALSNWGGDNNFYGLSEVQFNSAVAAVPEPASLTLLGLCGLGVAGRAWKRRRASI